MTVESAHPIRIATRGSRLALWQTQTVARMLDRPCRFVRIQTSGDANRNVALQGASQTGFFTREVETALLDGRADIAVHSLKDLPTTTTPGTVLAAFLPRGPVQDMLLVHPDWHLSPPPGGAFLPLKPGCRIGAGSLRRQALATLYHSNIHPDLIRGNVPTRVEKCRSGEYGATVMARAGLERLGLPLHPLRVYQLNPDVWLPAPAQGIVAIQCLAGREHILEILKQIDDPLSRTAAAIERGLLARFEGGCHTAFGALAAPLDHPGQWSVAVGMDRPGNGWGAMQYTGPQESVSDHGPTELNRFEPVNLTCLEDLCCPVPQSF